MRSFERDFVDDYIDDISGGLLPGALPSSALTSPLMTPLAVKPSLVPSTLEKVIAPTTTAAKDVATSIAVSTPTVHPALETPGAVEVVRAPGDPINQVLGELRSAAVQRAATSEHYSRAHRDAFRRSTLARLARIEAKLARISPDYAAQMRTVRVILGNG